MAPTLRFTGEWPNLEHWKTYPNWENALGEEDVPGQDETTLRPSDDQTTITANVTFTAATAELASGLEIPAILELNAFEIYGVTVLSLGYDGWRLVTDAKGKWKPFNQHWLPEAERSPVVFMTDDLVFPLRIISRLKSAATGALYYLTIKSDGSADVT